MSDNKYSSEEIRQVAHEIAENMITYGGSFVKCIGQAMHHADYFNLMTLIKAFPEYMNEYHPDVFHKWVEK